MARSYKQHIEFDALRCVALRLEGKIP